MKTLKNAFDLLDQWRHLPSYRLEPRVDVFFALYLKEFLEARYSQALMEIVIPEFPLKKTDDKQSNKVDFVLMSKDYTVVYFVELKTDMSSHRVEQKKYLQEAVSEGFFKIIENLREIAMSAGKHRNKYYYLLDLLEQAGFITLPTALGAHTFPKFKPGLTAQLRKIEIKPLTPKIQVVYVQPIASTKPNEICISFDDLITFLGKLNDEQGNLFADYLKNWKQAPAFNHPHSSNG